MMDARVISAFTRVFDALCPRMTGRSLREPGLLPQARRGGDARPLRDLALDIGGEFLGRTAEHVDALLLQRLDDVAGFERLVGRACELVDDVARRPGGGEQPAPDA